MFDALTGWFQGLASGFAGLSVFYQAAIVAAVSFLFLAVQTLRARKPLKLPPLKTDHKPLPVFKKLSLNSVKWVAQTLGDLLFLTRQSETLYRIPWVVLIGEEKSGKSSLAASLESSDNLKSLLEDTPLDPGVQGWWQFEQGMLIDFDSLVARSSRREVVEEFLRLRPERPIDSVVACVSAEELLSASKQDLNERALAIHDQLSRLQREFSFTFPVYLVITKADLLPGCPEFWRASYGGGKQLPVKEIFGWSNPGSLEGSYNQRWIEQAFADMQAALQAEQLRIAAESQHSDERALDDFFLFPGKFAELKPALGQVLDRIFRGNAYQANFFFRGLYFSGKIGAPDASQPQTEVLAQTPVSFIEQLFAAKVFAERHLARPVADSIWSRQVQIKRVQKLLLGGGLVLLLGLGVAALSLNYQVESVESILGQIDYQRKNASLRDPGECTGSAVVADTLGSLGALGSGLGSAFIPLSWVSDALEDQVLGFVSVAAIEDVVMGNIDCQFGHWQTRLQQASAPAGSQSAPIDAVGKAVGYNQKYMTDVIELQQALLDRQHLAEKNSGAQTYRLLADIYRKLYRQPLPRSVSSERALLADILQRADIDNYAMPGSGYTRISDNLGANINALNGLVTAALTSGKGLIAGLGEQNLDASQTAQLARWIDWIDRNWLPASGSAEQTACERIVAELDDELEQIDGFGVFEDSSGQGKFAQRLQITDCRNTAQQALAQVQLAPLGNLLVASSADQDATAPEPDSGSSRVVSAAWKTEADKLEALARLDFMQLSGADLVCDSQTVRWDVAVLQQMQKRMDELADFVPPSELNDGLDSPYEQLAKQRLAEVLNSLANQAQKSQLSVPVYSYASSGASSPAVVRQASLDFAQAQPRLTGILQQYADMGMREEGTTLATCAYNFAVSQLTALSAMANSTGVLKPTRNSAAANTGSAPLLLFDNEVQPDNWWPLALESAKSLVGYSSAYVDLLNSTKDVYALNATQSADTYYWSNTVNSMTAFNEGGSANQVSYLKTLFDSLAGLDKQNCPGQLASLPDQPAGTDLFSDRRQEYSALASSFCQSSVVGMGEGIYNQLAADFSRLEARFPFAAPGTRGEARISDTRSFFLDYAAQTDSLVSFLQAQSGNANAAANKELLNQFDGAVQFFNSHLAVQGQPTALALDVSFRSQESDGSEDVVTWMLTNGVDSVKRPPGETSLHWFYGQPLSFSFSWAANGNLSPQTDASQPQLSVDTETRTATFSFTGTWAFQRLIANHWASGTEQGNAAPKTTRLVFEVPVVADTNSDSSKADTAPAKVALYVDLDVTTTNSSGKATPVYVPQALPQSFPVSQPKTSQ